jgi:hypothetical protein
MYGELFISSMHVINIFNTKNSLWSVDILIVMKLVDFVIRYMLHVRNTRLRFLLKFSNKSDEVSDMNYVYNARSFTNIRLLTWINFQKYSFSILCDLFKSVTAFQTQHTNAYRRDSESNRAWMRLKMCLNRVFTRST